tara:strand:- start:8603 stop:8869 length:267 start_codon:yes stop_codon:yes gene_type:complete
MLTCKQVSNALSESDYEKLSPWKKFFLKLHVKLCIFCGKYNRQVMESQDMCRCYKQHEDSLQTVRPKLGESKKEELRRLLAKEAEGKH